MIVRAKQHIACVTIFIVYYQGLGRQFFAFAMEEKKAAHLSFHAVIYVDYHHYWH